MVVDIINSSVFLIGIFHSPYNADGKERGSLIGLQCGRMRHRRRLTLLMTIQLILYYTSSVLSRAFWGFFHFLAFFLLCFVIFVEYAESPCFLPSPAASLPAFARPAVSIPHFSVFFVKNKFIIENQ